MDSRLGSMEAVLGRATAHRATPYHWLARAVSNSAHVVLDVGCGAGAMTRELHRPERSVIGIDLSAGELRLAASKSPGQWVQADARALPVAAGSVDAVTSAMGLAVVQPAELLISEVSRVLKPGGVFAALVPTVAPASVSELALAAQLSWALRSPLRFPGSVGVNFGRLLLAGGLTKVEDQRERYRFVVRLRADADTLFEAIDHAGIGSDRIEGAIQLLGRRTMAAGEVTVAIPMRRIVAIK